MIVRYLDPWGYGPGCNTGPEVRTIPIQVL